MKGIWVLFQMRYGSLICSKEWLSDRPKWRGMLADPGATQPKQEAKQQKTTVLEWCENKGLPQLSDCHLAVCWSWGGYYTSSERGHPRLSADIWILTFDQLIGILWSYFEMLRGLANMLNILVCHLPIFRRSNDYHIPFESEDKELSVNSKCYHIPLNTSFFWLDS